MLIELLDGEDKRLRREKEWIGILIHHTGIIDEKTKWDNFSDNVTKYLSTKDKNYVSAHFSIKINGIITQIIDPDIYEAWHAGKSSYWHPIKRQIVPDWNRYAIGIELVGDGNKYQYCDAQYKSLIDLIKFLMSKYKSVHPLAIIGHENVSPNRKIDPGKLFDWDRLFRGIYGG